MSASTTPALKAGTPVIQQVLARVLSSPDGQPISGADLTGIADRKLVENALRTLTDRGEVLRVIPGYFTKPLPSAFEVRRRTLNRLVGAAVAQTGHIAVPDGATSAFELGLIPQAPILARFLTTAEERTFAIGRVRVTFVNAGPWWFVLHDRLAGDVVRALGWAGPSRVAATWRVLCAKIPPDVLGEVEAESARLPPWMTAAFSLEGVSDARRGASDPACSSWQDSHRP